MFGRVPTRVVGLAVAVLVSTILSPAESVAHTTDDRGVGAADEHHRHEEHRAGDPSTDGPVVRSSLPVELRNLASDASMRAINAPEFAAARQAWQDDERLLYQIDYQLSFRASVDYMSSDPGHVADLVRARRSNPVSDELGLFVSDEEAEEFTRRFALGETMEAIHAHFNGRRDPARFEGVDRPHHANYGGMWLDQMDGGRIVVAVVDSSKVDIDRLHDIAGNPDDVRLVEQPYSYDELVDLRRTLEARLAESGLGYDLQLLNLRAGQRFELRLRNPDDLPDAALRDVPPGLVTKVRGPIRARTSGPTFTHDLNSDMQGGLDIRVIRPGNDANCTWGFNGHTNTHNYIVTAGHCLGGNYSNFTGNYVDDIDIHQNGSAFHDLTDGHGAFIGPFVRSFNDADNTRDIARISSDFADTNCYHGDTDNANPHCRWRMSARAWSQSWELNQDMTCASLGRTNDYRCGFITEVGIDPNRVRAEFVCQPGDSGSGLKWSHRIDGILTDCSIDGSGNPVSGTFFQQAYDAQRFLGDGYFYFNCANGETTNTASNWGRCPGTNA